MKSNGDQLGRASQTGLLLVIAYLGFISLGLPDTLIGVAWPRARDTFGLQQAAVALIFVGAGLSYFFSSLFTGKLMGRLGVGMLLAASSTLVALSSFGYATAPVWAVFALCSVLHGFGSGAIDAGLNHYVAHHFSARQMNWLHACYSLGATLGPLIMTAALTAAGSWRLGYAVVAAILALLAFLFFQTRRKWDDPNGTADTPAAVAPATVAETLAEPVVWLQIALFFFYTGLEVTVGQWAFTVLVESRHMAPAAAGVWVACYWGSIAAGRIGFGFLAEGIGLDRLLRWSAAAVVVGTAAFAWNVTGAVSMAALVLIGLGLAPIYPCTMTRTPQRLGSAQSAHAIGFQVSAAMVGAAALPSLSGWLAQSFTLEVIPMATLAMAVAVLALHETILRAQRKQLQAGS